MTLPLSLREKLDLPESQRMLSEFSSAEFRLLLMEHKERRPNSICLCDRCTVIRMVLKDRGIDPGELMEGRV